MLYEVTFVDGSRELVEADNIAEARAAAQKLYDTPIRRVVVEREPLAAEEVDEETDEEDDDDE